MEKTKEGYTKSADGTGIYYMSEGSGFPIVACNGILCSTGYWHYLRPFFRDRCQVVTWDYRGHGKSEVPADMDRHTMDDFAGDLLAVMDELKIEKAVLTGHSMGVQLILEFYRKHPDRVYGLVPVLGTYGKPFTSFYGQAWPEVVMPAVLRQGVKHATIFSALLRPLFRSPIMVPGARMSGAINWYLAPGDIMRDYFLQISKMNFEFAFKAVLAMDKHTCEDILGDIKVPVLIIAGENDPFTPPKQSEKMHDMIPNSEILMIHKGTHTALIEQPDLMHLRMEVFLRDHFKAIGYQPLENLDDHLFERKMNGIEKKRLRQQQLTGVRALLEKPLQTARVATGIVHQILSASLGKS